MLTRVVATLLAYLILVGIASTASSSAGNDFTLVLRERLGPYRYWASLKHGRAYGKAIAAFGRPSSSGKDTPTSNLCTVRWERIGLDVGFAGEVGGCGRFRLRRAAWFGMRLWGGRWKTARGLRVGDPVGEIRQLYPRARYVSDPPLPGEWWLVTERHPDVGVQPLLVAEVGAGRVIAIQVPAGYIF